MPSFPMLRRSPKRSDAQRGAKSAETTEDEGSRSGSPGSPSRSDAPATLENGGNDASDKKSRVSTRELLYEIRSRLVGKTPPSPLTPLTPQRGRTASQPAPPQNGLLGTPSVRRPVPLPAALAVIVLSGRCPAHDSEDAAHSWPSVPGHILKSAVAPAQCLLL